MCEYMDVLGKRFCVFPSQSRSPNWYGFQNTCTLSTFILLCATDVIVDQVGELVGLTEAHLKALLLHRSSSWSLIETINGRHNKFGANAAAEFEVKCGCDDEILF